MQPKNEFVAEITADCSPCKGQPMPKKGYCIGDKWKSKTTNNIFEIVELPFCSHMVIGELFLIVVKDRNQDCEPTFAYRPDVFKEYFERIE